LLIRHSYVANQGLPAGRCPDLARLAKAGTFRPFSDIYLHPLLWCCSIWFRGWVITNKVSWERGIIHIYGHHTFFHSKVMLARSDDFHTWKPLFVSRTRRSATSECEWSVS
jgi:hypothetical protein